MTSRASRLVDTAQAAHKALQAASERRQETHRLQADARAWAKVYERQMLQAALNLWMDKGSPAIVHYTPWPRRSTNTSNS